ncbi:MAG: small ribosomal subunit biogenesis GTPase RsgA [Halieaceae bacterium]|nr:small ribosomal subunit biogenesis GTPase RsgA [Halieaceae bacterium]
MSKRKLSRQQAWRVEKIQEERAKRAARRDEAAQGALSGGELGPEQDGLIVAHYGTQVAVESIPGSSCRCHLRANLDGLVTGDHVIWREGDPFGVVVAQRPRRSELCRPDPYGKLKPVAANIDRIMLVIAPYPEPHANLIDRYLVAADAVGIEPVILLNKVDLLTRDTAREEAIHSMLSIYRDLGYKIIHTSVKTGGTEALHCALEERTSVFVGQSGVGKSSLVNALLPGAQMPVGPLSENNQKGTHTTTTAQLLHLQCGGSLIDSPGVREFGLWHMTREQVEQGFREFQPLLGHCKFRDCQHEEEPGCAILQCVATGDIGEQRLQSYRRIVASLEDSRQ